MKRMGRERDSKGNIANIMTDDTLSLISNDGVEPDGYSDVTSSLDAWASSSKVEEDDIRLCTSGSAAVRVCDTRVLYLELVQELKEDDGSRLVAVTRDSS